MPVPTVTLTGEGVAGIGPSLEAAIPPAREVKLGRIRPDPLLLTARRMLVPKLADYIDLAQVLKALPASVDWYTKAQQSIGRMYLNDTYGDCVIAGKYHAHGVWTAQDTASTAVGTDNEVYSTYQSWCGPGDNGCVIQDVLDRCKSTGIPMNGTKHKIDGYADCDNRNKDLTKAALYLFGCVSLGINLPSAWTSAAVWDVTSTSIVGGHDVTAVGYDDRGVYISSWGKIYLITWAAYQSTKWIEEAWVLLAPDWYNSDQLAPNGVDVATLKADLAKIGGGQIPPVDPTPTPPPTPPTPGPTPATNLKGMGISLAFNGWTNGLNPGSVAQVTGTAKVTASAAEEPPQWEPFMSNIVIPSAPVEWFGVGVPGLKTRPAVVAGGDTPPAGLDILDLLLPLLRQLCTIAPGLPQPVNHLAGFLCFFLPPEGRKATAAEAVNILGILRFICQFAAFLPAPYGQLIGFACGLLPASAAGPCAGCK